MSGIDLLVYTLRYLLAPVFSTSVAIMLIGFKNKKQTIIGFVIYLIILIVIEILMLKYLSYILFKQLFAFVLGASTLIFWNIILDEKFSKIIFSYFVIQLSGLPINILANGVRYLLDNIITGWVKMIALPCILATLTIVSSLFLQSRFDTMYILLVLISIIISLSYYMYLSLLHSQIVEINMIAEKNHEYELQSITQQAVMHQLDSYDQQIELVRQYRHDVHHHNAIIKEYVLDNDKESLLEYVNNYDLEMTKTKNTIYCGNKIIDAILNIYNTKFAKQNTEFIKEMNFDKDSYLSQTELGSLISNLLENAYECECQLDDKSISLIGEETDDYIKIEAKNNTVKAVQFVNGLPKTSKKNGGIGTISIKRIVDKYNGMVTFTQENNEFIVRIFIGK